MRRPDFLIIGSQKAGTTALHRVLRAHPGLWLPPEKDLNYFFDDRRYAAGPDRYLARFAEAPAGALCGETSPGYLVHPRSPARIARLLPAAKLIVTVREPIARALSQYWDHRRWLAVHRPFADFCRGPLPVRWRPGQPGYISRGVYAPCLARYRALFGAERVLVLRFAELKSDPRAFYRRAFAFLGVDPDFECAAMQTAHNPRSIFDNPVYRFLFHRPSLTRALPPGSRRVLRSGGRMPWASPPLDPALQRHLARFYGPWNARLEAMLGVELGWPGG